MAEANPNEKDIGIREYWLVGLSRDVKSTSVATTLIANMIKKKF